METRSRKRAEATSTALPSSSGPTTRSGKRFRNTQSSATTVPTRTRVTRAHPSPMDPFTPVESASSSSRSRRNRSNYNESSSSDKGKAKEHEVRVRDRDNRSLKLDVENYNNPNEEDDDDSEGGIGAFHQNVTSASSALQGLLRKLGAGFDDLLPASGVPSSSSSLQHLSGRMKKILSGLQADGEEGKQVEALTQLCDILSIGTEESLSSFSVDIFVPVLVGLLSYERNSDIMLLAARAITHLCDVLPSSCGAVVHYGAIPFLVNRLVTIQYMDLAEQSLQALMKISVEHPTACLRAGALMAALSYLDFFSIGVQRIALSTAANMCKKIPSDASHFAMDAVPLLTSRLQYHDTKVLEQASVCLTRIAEAFASCPDRLDVLCNHGVVTEAASLISSSSSGGGQTSLSSPTYTGLIRLLSTCASGSPLGTKTLLHLGISGILKDILSGSSVSSNSPVPPALSRSAEQMFEIVNLANELLPPLPPGTVSIPAGTNNFVRGPIIKKSTSSNSGKQESSEGNVHQVSAREKLLKDHPELLKQFGMDLLPVMIQMYGSSVNSSVRHKCLSVIAKLMYFSNAEMIQSLISVTNISSFLAGVLAWKDAQVLVPALQIAEILMEKLPTTFSKIFVREGVLHAIDQLAVSGNPATNSVQSSLAEKDNDSLGVTSRSRRYKRRGDSAHKDGSSFEDSKNPIFGSSGSPPSSSEILMGHSNLRMHVGACAKAFKDKYFPLTAEVGVTEDLLYLKNLCAKLNAGVNDQKTKAKGKSKATGSHIMGSSASQEEYLIGIISEILTELSKGDGVSTFEFVGSGVVSALLNYLTCGFFSKERISEANLPKLREQALKRFKLFISLALPSVNDEISATRMTILVQKLQNALTSLERFPVVLSQSSRSYGGSAPLSSGLGALAQTFKLRLCRAQGDKSLRDYSSNVVLIDPLASLAAVEQFLWPRVQRGESGQKSSASAGNSEAPTVAGGCSPSPSTPSSNIRRHSSRSKSSYGLGDTSKEPVPEKNASSLKGKGKAVVKATQEDAKGPQTRNATRRRAALVKEEQVKPENGDSSSEDEELDISLVEMDDAMIIEDDDISEEDDDDDNDDDHDDVLRDDSVPACMTDRVLDVKLGNPSEDSGDAPAISDTKTSLASGSSSRTAAVTGSDSVDFRIGSSYGSRGALSFAAATMSGLGSANGRGIRGERDRQGRSMFGSSNDPPKLIFTAGGKQLNRNLTIYQAVQRQLIEEEDDDQFTGGDFMANGGSRIWNDVYTITYQRADTQADGATAGATSSTTASKSKKGSSSSTSDGHSRRLSLLDSILQGELPCDLEKSNPTYNILALLRVLEGLNQLAPRLRMQMVSDNFVEGKTSSLDVLNCSGVKVSSEDFINTKLTTKLARQVQDALALCSGSVPPWCFQLTQACPFLFPFETRRQYFYSTAFGLSRALNRLQQQQGADGHASNNERELRVGRLQRQKVRVSRNRILDSALKVMEMYSSQKAVLEVEYFGEVGTGLGPTLEFYTLLSRDLQKLSLGMWRSNVSSGIASMDIDDEGKDGKSTKADLVEAPLGLFPQPWPPNADASEGSQYFKVIEYFRLVGRVMAKALQDGRLLDLPLSMAFYKLVLGQELDLFDILSFDMELGKVLQELHAIVVRKHYLESSGNDTKDAAADLSFHGASIEDLCFDFTLPGYPEYVLKPGNETVDINNLEEYVSLVVDATVKTGIVRQMEAFRDGFNQVFDISSLQIFSPEELDYLLCGRRELWEPETLVDYIKFDHGYTAKSPAIVNLLEIMGEFNPEQQRAFCQFVTGAPRLPPGGLAVLNPRLTIVRKLSSTAGNAMVNGSGGVSECADEDLPSVMTCANYLKLPPYSTKEIMFQKLVFAINEGQGSFDLS